MAQPSATVDDYLTFVDGMLVPLHATRTDDEGTFCEFDFDPPPPTGTDMAEVLLEGRAPYCDNSEALNAWEIRAPHHETKVVRAWLEVRRMKGDADERRRWQLHAFGQPGWLSWCNSLVTWEDDLLWILHYGCGISHHVTWVTELRRELLQRADPVVGVSGVLGTLGGGSGVVDADGNYVTLTDAEKRAGKQFLRVVEVEPGDSLNVRVRFPTASGRGARLPPVAWTLAPNTSCVELLVAPEEIEWSLIRRGEDTGWVARKHLESQPRGACQATPSPTDSGVLPVQSRNALQNVLDSSNPIRKAPPRSSEAR